MKQRNKKRFDAAFKARVALEALQEKESLAQIGRRHGVHPVQVGQWKKQLLERSAAAFETDAGRDTERGEEELLQKIGELTVRVGDSKPGALGCKGVGRGAFVAR